MAGDHPRPRNDKPLTSVEICAGAGGQAVGLHQAGFHHLSLVEWDRHAVNTLKANVGAWPGWDEAKVDALEPGDVKDFLCSPQYQEIKDRGLRVDLLAGGVPCPPFSLAGKRLGADDERDLFPDMLKIVADMKPKAIMIENVRGILEPPHVFLEYRRKIINELYGLGYDVPLIKNYWSNVKQNAEMSQVWRKLEAKDFGVPQLRPRAVLVAIHRDFSHGVDFTWPIRTRADSLSVYEKLKPSMRERFNKYWSLNKHGQPSKKRDETGEYHFDQWQDRALKALSAGVDVAPTLVGGSRKHGGADLGPSRAKQAWAVLGVDGNGVANEIEQCDPARDLFRPNGPMLTVEQAAIIQGFPAEWEFQGGKTARYRQVGNAFPPPVAEAVGRAIAAVLRPELRSKLLESYVMDDGTALAGASDSEDQPAIF
ncbi:DNA cytosine methyltransferase [Streptomyces sp. NPDC055025]